MTIKITHLREFLYNYEILNRHLKAVSREYENSTHANMRELMKKTSQPYPQDAIEHEAWMRANVEINNLPTVEDIT